MESGRCFPDSTFHPQSLNRPCLLYTSDSSHITLSVRNDFICKIVTDRYLGLLKEAFKTVLGFDVDITLVVPSTPPHEVVLAQQYEANPASPQGNYEFTFENFIKLSLIHISPFSWVTTPLTWPFSTSMPTTSA